MRTLLVLSLALFLVVACLQADAKRINIPEDPPAEKLKGTTTISGRRLLGNDNDDNENNKAHGTANDPNTEGSTHRNVINGH